MRPEILRRKGSTALVFLLFLSGLLTLSCGLLFYMEKGRESLGVYENGLKSVYAAESGANLALAKLAKIPINGKLQLQSQPFSQNGRDVKVTISELGEEGTVFSIARDSEDRYIRYVKITYTVEMIGNNRYIRVGKITSDGHF